MAASDKVKEVAAVDLGALLDAGEGAVVTLVAGETRLAAHKAVLSARSPVFGAMFEHDTLEASSRQVAILDVEGPVLRQLLVYLYTLQVPQLLGMALQLLPAADKYSLLALKVACEQQLAEQLSVETAASTAVLAVRHTCTSLRQTAIAFIKANTHQVMATKGWADAMRTYTEDLVEVSRLLTEPPSETSAPTAPAGADRQPIASTLSKRQKKRQRQSQTNSSHGQTPAAAAPPTSAPVTTPPEDSAASSLRGLTSEEKRRRLREATQKGRVGEVEALLAAGADARARDSLGVTAMHCAAHYGHLEVARLLLGGGAEVNARDCEQQTPLHYAAYNGDAAVVRLLAAAFADHNARDMIKETPLHVAARYCNTEAASALLQAGADRRATNFRGVTPLDIARVTKKQDMIQLLS